MKPIHGYIQDIFRSDYNFIATRVFEFWKFCIIRIIKIHLKIITEYYYLFYLLKDCCFLLLDFVCRKGDELDVDTNIQTDWAEII